MTAAKAYRPGRGYVKKDWDAVNSPEPTDQQLAKAKPLRDALPELYAGIKRSRGRPKAASPKEAVTLRLPPDVVEKFKASGDDWRTKMAKVLKRAKV